MNNITSGTIESSITAVASKATGAGSAVSVVSWFAAFDFGLWMGILIGVAGLIVNGYFRLRADRRNLEAHKAYLVMTREVVKEKSSVPLPPCSSET